MLGVNRPITAAEYHILEQRDFTLPSNHVRSDGTICIESVSVVVMQCPVETQRSQEFKAFCFKCKKSSWIL